LNKKGGRAYRLQPEEKWGTVEEPIEYIPLKQIIHKKGILKNSDIQKTFGISRFKATKLAKRFVEVGLLRKEGKGKGSRYLAIKE